MRVSPVSPTSVQILSFPACFQPTRLLDGVLGSSFLQVYSINVCQHQMSSRGKMSSPTTTLNCSKKERGEGGVHRIIRIMTKTHGGWGWGGQRGHDPHR